MEMKLNIKNLFFTYESDGDEVRRKFDFNQTVIDLVKTIKGKKHPATDIYTHITASAKRKIKSPLANLELKNDK